MNTMPVILSCCCCLDGLGGAFAVAVVVSLFLGLVLGVAGSVAAYKLVKWMEGKTVIFSPWPRIQSAM